MSNLSKLILEHQPGVMTRKYVLNVKNDQATPSYGTAVLIITFPKKDQRSHAAPNKCLIVTLAFCVMLIQE